MAAATKAPKKAAPKKKAVAKKVAVKGAATALGPAKAGVSLTKAECKKQLTTAKGLLKKIGESYMKLAFSMADIFDNSSYSVAGYERFTEWVDAEMGFEYRKAMYLVSIGKWARKLSPEALAWAERIGWSAAKELTGVVTSENFEEWRDRLENKSVRDVERIIREHAAGDGGGDGGDGKKAAPAAGGKKTAPAASTRKMTIKMDKEDDRLVMDAISRAKKAANTSSDGRALALMATDYLAGNGGVDMTEHLSNIQSMYGVQLIAVKGDEVVFGGDALDKLAGPDPDDDDGDVVGTLDDLEDGDMVADGYDADSDE